ncbi:MAG TPA: helix-turn-helix domain-containing protein [Streptosporangiaceae bacterium]|nr:helix-turn-helix domain-containing protein [Streptosporangiaceae bacterium]
MAASRRGRQAEAARNDLIVLAAAREVFAAQGADAPVSAVASRAGVGVGSLYRRYGSKDDLLRELCLLALRQSVSLAEQSLQECDAWEGLTRYIREAVAQGTGALAPLAGSIATTPEMWSASRRGRELLGMLVQRAQTAGALRDDVTALDIAHLIELFGRLGPDATESASPERAIRLRLLAIALDGLRVERGELAASPLPGAPPTTVHYEARWAGEKR